LWDKRAETKWGLPANEFDEKYALLLIDDDDDETEDDSIEYVTASYMNQEDPDADDLVSLLNTLRMTTCDTIIFIYVLRST